MEKYKIKETEALFLADFLLPMLEYLPEKRATAQEMLNHPWLTQQADFDYMMNEREFEKLLMFKKNNPKKERTDEVNCDVIESENEQNLADDEDNDEYLTDEEYASDDSFAEADVINIQNFNNSFAAYGQHVDLAALDRANPQFEKIAL